MNPHDDEWDVDDIEDEEAIALRAVEAWLDVEGDDELAQASRAALAAIAQEALAMKEAREQKSRLRSSDSPACAEASSASRTTARKPSVPQSRRAKPTSSPRATSDGRSADPP